MSSIETVVAEIENLTVEEISPIVQSLVDDISATSEPGWLIQATGEMSIGAGTLGILKVSGTAHVKGEVTPWSVVIKAMELDGESGLFSPEREIAAFRSGFFDKLDRGLKSVPCHGVTTTNSGATLLWLEDLSNAIAAPWSSELLIATSKDIGYFNGNWPESNAPDAGWLDRTYVTNRPDAALQGNYGAMLPPLRETPEFQQIASRVGEEKVLGMFDATIEISEACKRLPQVVNHNDLHARNMFIDIDDRGGRTSYAIDWASVGIGPIGLDGGTLAGGEIGWKDHQAVQAAEIEGQMFESYMEGLEESNFRNYYPLDRSEVRLGYLSNFVVYLDLQVLACTDVSFNSQLPARFGIPKDETFDEISKRLELFMPQFDEAVALARQI